MGTQSNGWAAQPMSKSFPSTVQIDDQENAMKAPGRRAQPGGKKLKGGEAIKVVCYPRPLAKAMLVHASRMANRSLSSFLILSGLGEAARLKGVHIDDLVPQHELDQYLRVKA